MRYLSLEHGACDMLAGTRAAMDGRDEQDVSWRDDASIERAWLGATRRFRATSVQGKRTVSVDESGVPQDVDPSAKLPEAIRNAIRQRVMQWRFEPAIVDGKPKPGKTHVFIDACAVPQAGGGMNLMLDYSRNGPGYADGALRLPPPSYPSNALRAGREGRFRVIVKVDAAGQPSVESIEIEAGRLPSFEPTLRAWVASMRFVPEQVDGKPVPTHIGIPVHFATTSLSPKEMLRNDRKEMPNHPACLAAAKGEGALDPVVIDSPFKLRSTES